MAGLNTKTNHLLSYSSQGQFLHKKSTTYVFLDLHQVAYAKKMPQGVNECVNEGQETHMDTVRTSETPQT